MAALLRVAMNVVLSLFASDPPPDPAKPAADGPKPVEVKSIYDLTMKDIDGKDLPLSKYKGDVLLIVNTASKCGFTPQYEGMESVHQKYKDRGFAVLAFPANNFGAQEPGPNDEIKTFCTTKYNVSFPLFAKVSVKGDDQCPLYRYLTGHPNKDIAGEVKWNFQKYLVARDGTVLAKFGSKTTPEDKDLAAKIEEALKAEKPKGESKAPTEHGSGGKAAG